MKKACVLILAALVFLSSCSGPVMKRSRSIDFNTDEVLDNFDYDQGLSHLLASCAITDDTIYFINPFLSRATYALGYADKASGVGGPLCGKPECTHTNNTCDSYIYMPIAFGLSDYDGALYWSGADASGYYICRVNYDGTNRANVRELDRQMIAKLNGSPFSFVHRGYMYFCGGTSGIENGEQKLGAIVFAYDLESNEDSITIFEKDYSEYTVSSTSIQPYKNGLYIMASLQDNDKNRLELYKWNIETRETETVYEGAIPFFVNEFFVTDDGVLFSDTSSGNVYNYSFEHNEVSHYLDLNIDGGEFYRILIANGLFVGRSVDEGKQVIRAVDFNGELVLDKSFSVDVLKKDKVYLTIFCGSDNSYLYFYYSDYITGGNSEYLIAFPLDGGEAKLLWEEV